MSERNHLIEVQCRLCGEVHELVVNYEDYQTYRLPNRPHVQDCFPYLSPEERELLISGTCDKCWNKMFPPEPEFDEDFLDDEEKMADFVVLSKEEFLASYSYLTEKEYDATKEAYDLMKGDSNNE